MGTVLLGSGSESEVELKLREVSSMWVASMAGAVVFAGFISGSVPLIVLGGAAVLLSYYLHEGW